MSICSPAYLPKWWLRSSSKELKSISGKAIKARLTILESKEFDQQRGLSKRQFWQRGFRSIVVDSVTIIPIHVDVVMIENADKRRAPRPVPGGLFRFRF